MSEFMFLTCSFTANHDVRLVFALCPLRRMRCGNHPSFRQPTAGKATMSMRHYFELGEQIAARRKEIEQLEHEIAVRERSMAALGDLWTCDECGTRHLEPRGGHHPPIGWYEMKCKRPPYLRVGCPMHPPDVATSDDIVSFRCGTT